MRQPHTSPEHNIKLALLTLLLLGLLAALTSCSDSRVIYKARVADTNNIIGVTSHLPSNFYNPNDTVWVVVTDNTIVENVTIRRVSNDNRYFSKAIIISSHK